MILVFGDLKLEGADFQNNDSADESEKGSASLSEVLLAPKTSHSYAGEDSPASVAINHGLPYFDYVCRSRSYH